MKRARSVTRPAVASRKRSAPSSGRLLPAASIIPPDADNLIVRLGERAVQLTNLRKPFWREPLITKGDLLRYYAQISPTLLPHLRDRAMVMKRYPNGADGEFFFMKRAPAVRPDWIEVCPIEHESGNVIEFPMIQDLPSLLWVINLGCIDLNQWYAPCDDVDRPDALHFDLDPVPGAEFAAVRDTAVIVRDALAVFKMPSHAKTTGSRGIHVYVPIVRGPTQKQVWQFAKQLAHSLAALYPKLITAEYRVAHRPAGRILVDFNQNAWGRTLASVYSVRPRPLAPVSTPLSWQEVEGGIGIEEFRIDNVPDRIRRLGDLWAPLLKRSGRFRLEKLL